MNRMITKGIICLKNKENIECRICAITHIQSEDGTFTYIFEPDYSVISCLDCDIFQGIPGIDIDLKKKEYIRDNILPTFISERVPQENREDYQELLEEAGMEYMNPLEYLMKTKTQYSGDLFYVVPYEEKKMVFLEDILSKENTAGTVHKILCLLGRGDDVRIGDITVTDENRNMMFRTMDYIYKKSLQEKNEKRTAGIASAKEKNSYKGRKPKEIDQQALAYYENLVTAKKMSIRELCEKLHISRTKYYRIKNVNK